MTVRTMTNTVRRREVSDNVRRKVSRFRRRRRRIEKDNNVERVRTVRTEDGSGKDHLPSIMHCETQCFIHT